VPPSRPKIDVPFTSEAEIAELVRLFESCELPYERWTHRAHLAVAVAYLQRYSLLEATERARTYIPRYNMARGDPNGYHETLTVLFMRLVDREMRAMPNASPAVLVNDMNERYRVSWLLNYYTPELLWSAGARTAFVPPDLRALDF
jgi:hypothetical protein